MTEGFKGWAKRLERASRENMIAIAQKDGTIERFPEAQLQATYLNALHRSLGSDEPEHPILAAIRNARDPQWANMWADLLDNDADEPDDLAE